MSVKANTQVDTNPTKTDTASTRVKKPFSAQTRFALGRTTRYAIMIFFALITALPFLWTALMSVRPNSSNVFRPNHVPEILIYPGLIGWGEGQRQGRTEGIYRSESDEAFGWWTDYTDGIQVWLEENTPSLEAFTFPATTANYYRVWTDVSLPRYFVNSALVAFGVVTLQLVTSSLAAYPLSKMTFRGRDTIFYIILSTLIFPEQLTLIPTYIMAVNYLGFADTLHGLIIPFGANAFGIFLLRQTYQSIPNELIEAARIDGASDFGIWWRILLPLIRPGLATLGIFSFVGSWNNFLWPLLMLRDETLYTLPLGLAFLEGAFTGNLRTVAAGVIIATVPIIIVFLMFQRQFIQGLSGAVKG